MNTPDTEWEKAELAVFWDEIAQHLPKCMERNALGDEKIFHAFATAYPKMKKHLLTSRDTYWKERVQKALKTVAYREVTVRGGMYSDDKYRGPNEEVIRLVKMQDVELVLGITNEDNLK